MLTELRIDNFAIIHHLEIEFSRGLVTFTGETGAGKSIILDAIEAVLGGKVDGASIRAGADRARVEAAFRLQGEIKAPVTAILEREDLLDDPDTLVLERDIRREGRATARVNGRGVNQALLRELGAFLVDIHGQSEHLSLLNTKRHLSLLDRYAGDQAPLAAYTENYRRIQAVRRELDDLRQAERDAARRSDLLTFQSGEIEAAHVRPGEDEELKQDRNRLANAENLANLAQSALTTLEDGSPEAPAIGDLLGQVVHDLAGLSRIDPQREEAAQQAQLALDTLAEIGRDLRDYLEQIEYNPRRLAQIEERLDALQNLKRKYGGTLEAVLSFGAEARRQLDTIAHAGERIGELEQEEAGLLMVLSEQGQALSELRRSAAQKMARAVEGQLDDLKMAGARFAVDFQTRPEPNGRGLTGANGESLAFDQTGVDQVEFLIAPNPGEGLNPLVKIASGGETARLMLALKNVLAQVDEVPTLIFDEIDQGIGGRVGMVVGEKLWRLGKERQVLCVTHLPQLAVFADQHFRVAKQVDGGRTITQVEEMSGGERQRELAQMLGGVSDGTLRSADEMLQAVQEMRAGG